MRQPLVLAAAQPPCTSCDVAANAIIWHAAVDLQQTWLWFVTGIVAGALIIAMFAVFEKKRETVLRVVDDLKKWEA
jgi:hypothetical protein